MKQAILSNLLVLCLAVGSFLNGHAQDAEETIWAYQTFRDTRIVNGHSVETGTPGEMKFIISHRFGNISGGPSELFGLDYGTIRYGLDYAFNKALDIGIGRSSYEKTFDAYFKKKLFYQKKGAQNFPATIVFLSTLAVNGTKWAYPDYTYFFSSRLSYTQQLIIARKFSDRFSMQIMPTFLHRNIVDLATDHNDLYSLGIAGRYQWTKATAVQFEYYYTPSKLHDLGGKNCLSIGFEFQTKAHVFQLHLSNSSGMIEPLFITDTRNKWTRLAVGLGFNITRDFKLRGRKY